jgi:hypothetical protein
MPTLQKKFFEQTSFGREWEDFWQNLWGRAAHALRSSDEIVVIGYSMTAVDQKARELLLHCPSQDTPIAVYCGEATAEICSQFREHGFRYVRTSGERRFEDYLADPTG